MTVSSATNRKTFAGDDATISFATTPIKFFATSDLQVYVTNDTTGVTTLLTEDTHYTVSGGDAAVGATGTVDTSGGSSPHGALLLGTTLVIVRELAILQGADFVNNDASNANVAEAALDKLVMNVQRLDDRLDRSLVVSDGDVSGADFTVPTPTASSLLGWASDALSIVNYELTDLTVSAVPAYALDIITAADDDAFFATMVDGMTAESALAVGDLFAFVDVSETPDDGRKVTVQQLWNSLNVLTAETAPAVGDSVALYDADGSATDKITLANLLKVVNGLTEDTAPDHDADYVATYDADGAAAKKVLLSHLGAGVAGSVIATTTADDKELLGSLPSWVNRVEVDLIDVSLSGTDAIVFQISDSGGYETATYSTNDTILVSAANPTVTARTDGWHIPVNANTFIVSGRFTLTRIPGTNTYLGTGTFYGKTAATTLYLTAGYRTLDGDLTAIRLSSSGTDTFDAGSAVARYYA